MPETYPSVTRPEVEEKNSSVETCSVKIKPVQSLSNLYTVREMRADDTFLCGGEEGTARSTEQCVFAGWARAGAGGCGCRPGLGAALAGLALGAPRRSPAVWEGAPGGEGEIVGQLCQGRHGDLCVLDSCTKFRCLIR